MAIKCFTRVQLTKQSPKMYSQIGVNKREALRLIRMELANLGFGWYFEIRGRYCFFGKWWLCTIRKASFVETLEVEAASTHSDESVTGLQFA